MTVEPFYPPNEDVLNALRSLVLPTDYILDVGSGDRRSHDIKVASIKTVDVWPKSEPDYLRNLEVEDLPDGNFDVILMIDFLEHISRERSLELLEQAKKLAKSMVIVLTPLIWDDNEFAYTHAGGFYQGNEHVKHKCLYTLDDFKDWHRIHALPLDKYYFGYWFK